MKKKAMLGSMIGGFVAILVGVMLIGTVSQELDNAINCNQTSINYGKTDSFGGAGTEHFGGYDGTVVHKSFMSNFNVIPMKEGESVLNPDCTPIPEGSWIRIIVALLPGFFALAIMAMAIGIMINALRNTGLV